MKKIFLLFSWFCLLQLVVSCKKTLSDEEIKEHFWKCGETCGLADVLQFDQNTILKNDTIFFKGVPYGKIVKRTNSLTEDTKIAIINLKNPAIKDTCIFHAK
jgi:glyceraldehyde-3-phosphate dehydrogenase/erythrose-4-phosphate dehydrogenase